MAENLINLKLPPPKPEEKAPQPSVLADGPRYPWGLSVRLEGESLDKLGISTLPAVGTEWLIVAKAKVTSVREEEYAGEEGAHSHKTVELQITDMCKPEPVSASGGDPTAALYGKAKA